MSESEDSLEINRQEITKKPPHTPTSVIPDSKNKTTESPSSPSIPQFIVLNIRTQSAASLLNLLNNNLFIISTLPNQRDILLSQFDLTSLQDIKIQLINILRPYLPPSPGLPQPQNKN